MSKVPPPKHWEDHKNMPHMALYTILSAEMYAAMAKPAFLCEFPSVHQKLPDSQLYALWFTDHCWQSSLLTTLTSQ